MNIPGIMGSPCMICREPNGWTENKLLRIRELCRNASKDDHGIRTSFNWGLHARCRYGLQCQKLRSYENRCSVIAEEIEERLVDAVLSDEGIYHRIYELCRGDFPAVCRELERIHGFAERAS